LRRPEYLAAIGLVVAALAILVITATLHYPGQPVLFVIFVLAFVCMAMLTLPKPRLYGYTLLALFLFLGFCAKAVAYFAIGIAMV